MKRGCKEKDHCGAVGVVVALLLAFVSLLICMWSMPLGIIEVIPEGVILKDLIDLGVTLLLNLLVSLICGVIVFAIGLTVVWLLVRNKISKGANKI